MKRPNKDPLLSIVNKKLVEWGLDTPGTKILTGVSGGLDSMALLHVLYSLGCTIAAAHVNYQLRGEDSDNDAALVSEWCSVHNIPFFSKVIDTKEYAEQNHLNIQKAAREIRYAWWQNL